MIKTLKNLPHKMIKTALVSSLAISLAACRDDVDYIVAAEYLVTMNENGDIIEHGAVAVDDGKIVAMGPAKEVYKDYQTKHLISGAGKALLPGLINGHTHSAMTLFRGIADDTELMTWLEETIFPLEAEFVTPEFVEVGARLACYEMITNGTTTFVDMYFHPEIIAKVVDDCGMRAILAFPMIDYPSPGFEGWDDSHAAGVEFVEKWQGKNPLITPALAPHAPYSVASQHLQQVGESARRLKAPISIHLAETYEEVNQIAELAHTTPILHALEQLGENQIIGAHTVFAQPQDYEAMASQSFGAIHNPTSNAKLASGIAPVSALLAANVAVGLGTDGAASNNDLNMLEEVKFAALLHKLRENDATALPASAALSLATSNGAKAIGMGDKIGQLAVGYEADLIQIDIDDTRNMPLYDVTSHLVYSADGRDIVTTMVAGKLLMENRKVLTINATKLHRDVHLIERKIKEKLHTKEQH